MIGIGRDWVRAEDREVLQVALSTPLDPSEAVRRPLNLVVVVDTSGSMSEDRRIGYAREGLHALIDQLGDADRMALVSYNESVTVRASLTEPSERAALHDAVDQLSAYGGTNLHDGLERGLQLALEAFDPERQNRVILVSDGIATVGIVDDPSIQAMADRYFSDEIGLTTVGVGLDFNVSLMRGLAERGAGSFYFLEDAAAIAEVFREELDTWVTPLAFDVELEVAAESGWQIGEVVGTRSWSGSARSGGVSLPAVFLASRESDEPGELGRRGAGGALFVSVVPTGGSVWDAGRTLASLRLGYRLPGGEERLDTRLDVDSGPDAPASADEVYLSDEAMAEHYAMYSMYLGLREATRFAGYGSYDCALGALERLDGSAASWQREFADPDIAADRELAAAFAGNLREAGARAPDGDFEAVCGEYGAYPPTGTYACSAGGGAGGGGAGALGWALAGLAISAAARRRRGGRARR
jgi:Ca-activated chloride channel family protein